MTLEPNCLKMLLIEVLEAWLFTIVKLSSTLHVCEPSASALSWKHLLGFLP